MGPGVARSVTSAEPTGSRTQRVLFALLPIAFLLSLLVFDIPICPTKRLLGLPCPGCGLTRATGAMIHLDLVTMWAMHPLAPIITPLVGWMLGRNVLVSLGLLARDSFDPIQKVPRFVWVLLVVALLGVWFARLAGFMGGHPDGFDYTTGWIFRICCSG